MFKVQVAKLNLEGLRQLISRLAALLVVIIAVAALIGWATGYGRFSESLRRSVPMHPTTAILLLAAVGSLGLGARKSSRLAARAGTALAAVVLVSGIVRLLFASQLPVGNESTSTRFTMAPLTSVNLILFGAGLFLIRLPRRKMRLAIFLLAVLPALTSLLTISKCLFINLAPQSEGQQPFPIALSAALAFLLLSTALTLELLSPVKETASLANENLSPSLANKLACGFGAAIFVLCGVGIFSYQSIAEFIDDAFWDNRSGQVLACINTLHGELEQNEDAQRDGTMVSDPESFQNTHRHAVDAISTCLTNLRSLTADDSFYQQMLRLVQPLIQQKLAIYSPASISPPLLTEQINILLSQMSARENRQMVERMTYTHTNQRRGVVLIGLSALFAFTLVIVAGWMLNRDIGGRERAQEALRASEELFRGLLQSAPDAMVITSGTGEIELINARVEELFGYNAQDLIGKHISVILPGGMNNSESASPDLSGLRKDGSRFPVEINYSPVRTLSGQCVSNAIRDVTPQRDEEHRLAYLNSALSESNLQLEAANKELEAFSYSVSHDLRAPLRSIDGFSQAILEDYTDKLDAEGQDHLHRVRAATQRMGQLIDDLLNLSRVTRAEMNREQVNLSQIARDIADELKTTTPEQDVEFVAAENVSAYTDARLIRIVLTNLLSNAWKFTAKRQRAHIEFGCVGENGKTEYFVRDNGAGFDPAHSSRLFGAFQRLHSATEYAGTGIGLATAHRIVRRQGGNIWAEGKVDEGATFHFTL